MNVLDFGEDTLDSGWKKNENWPQHNLIIWYCSQYPNSSKALLGNPKTLKSGGLDDNSTKGSTELKVSLKSHKNTIII